LFRKAEISDTVPFAGFGWGDKNFYINTPTWSDLTMKTAMGALFWNSPTAMHVTKYDHKQADFIQIPLCHKQALQLKSYIVKGFALDSMGHFQKIGVAGYSHRDAFFEGEGNYHCFRTCNSWINEGLKSAEVKTAIWSPFDKGVLYHAKRQ
jgi:uncharacterized protein (TIGR02117 family)